MNGPNQAPLPDANAPMPALPALRTFKLKRYTPGTGVSFIEEITVFAHLVQYTGSGGLVFSNYVIEPWGLDQRVRCGYASWIDFHEVVESESAIH